MSETPRFQMSADSRFLVQLLETAAVGDTISYAAMSEKISRSVDGSSPALATARRVLMRDKRMVFATIQNKGVKRLSDVEIVNTSDQTATKLRRAARRGVQTLSAVDDFSSLPRSAQMRHSASVSVFAAVAEMTREPSIAKVEKIAAKTGAKELPFAQTLAVFGGEEKK